MTQARRALIIALSLLGTSLPARAEVAEPDTAALEFHGFRAGARLDELQSRLRELGVSRLKCDRAKVDPRVSECRASFRDEELGGRVQLWVSAIDSVAGVITLSGKVAAVQLDQWRENVERSYGQVDSQVQGTQWMMQWVRRGRMLRLTWRIEGREKTASLSLVDGRVLDAWGKARRDRGLSRQ